MSISHGSRVTLREAVSSEHGMQEPIETEGGGGRGATGGKPNHENVFFC